jgi:hypothetical protein
MRNENGGRTNLSESAKCGGGGDESPCQWDSQHEIARAGGRSGEELRKFAVGISTPCRTILLLVPA